MIKKSLSIDSMSDEQLLNTRISELPIKIDRTWLKECVDQLYTELQEKGIFYLPECYLADEWLTPENETCIGIPFYLAHPRLIQLEKKVMMEAEGEGKTACMKLLRHEAGHAICYAYRFHKRKRWQNIFGPSTMEYKDTYKYRPYSKNYVRHLDGYYAQYHPEEDFVETFAVWLTPGSNWPERYKDWRAIKKLKYVDKLMQEVKNRAPRNKSSEKYYRVSTLRYTLDTYYKRKRHLLAEEFPDFHDRFLNRVFYKWSEENKNMTPAATLIRKHRRNIVNSVSKCSGEKKYVINDLINDVAKRSRELKCLSEDDDVYVCLNLSSYVTALVMNYQYTGWFSGKNTK